MIWSVPVMEAQRSLSEIRARAAEGDVEALNEMGNRLSNGQGVERSDQEAVKYYAQAADRSYAPASFNLGMMLELGRGAPKDIAQAFSYYLKAAQQGFPPAQFNVGNMYANGSGVEQDYFEAALWFRQAADHGMVEAQYNLGLAYEAGRGIAPDDEEAQRWYRLAVKEGYARAAYNLALMLEDGRGSPVDEVGAVKLYRAAAEKGFGPAQNNYGIMLAEGKGGLALDLVEAYIWFSLAVDNGVGSLGRDMVIEHLSAQQLAEANARLIAIRGNEKLTTVQVNATTPAQGAGDLQIEIDAFSAENTRLQSAYRSLQSERTELRAQLNQTNALNAKLTTEIELLSEQFEAKKEVTTDGRVQHLTETNRRLNREVRQSTMQLSRLSRELRLAESKLRNPPANSDSNASSADIDLLRNDLERLRATNVRLAAENSQLTDSGSSEAALQQFKQQIASANKATEEAIRRSEGFQQSLEQAQGEVLQASASRDELQVKLADSVSRHDESVAEFAKLTQTLRQTRTNLVSARRETEELRAQLQATQSELKLLARRSEQQLEKKASEVRVADQFSRDLEVSNENLETRVKSLESQLAATSQSSSASVEEVAYAVQRATEADAFARDLELANKRLLTQLDDLNASKAALTSQLDEVAGREKAQTEALAGLSRKLTESEILLTQHIATIADLTNAHAEVSVDKESLLLQITRLAAEADQAQKELSTARATLSENKQRAEILLAQSSSENARNQTLQAKVDELTARVSSLHTEQVRLSAMETLAAAQREDLTRKLSTGDKLIAQKDATIADLAGANTELDETKQALQLQLTRMSADADQAQKELSAAQASLSANEQRAEILLAQSSSESARNQTLQAKVDELTARVSSLHTEQVRLSAMETLAAAQREDLTRKLSAGDKLIAQKDATIADLAGANTELDETKQALQLQLTRMSAEADQAQEELSAARETLFEKEQRAAMLLAQSSSESETSLTLLQTKVDELTTRVAFLLTEQARLQESVQEVEDQAAEQLAVQEAALGYSRASLAQSQQEVQTLKTQVSSVQSDLKTQASGYSVETGDLATRLNVAEANVLRHQEEAGELRNENARLTDYENAFRASNEQVKSLRREITDVNQRLQATQAAKSEIDQIRTQLSVEVATLGNALAVKEQEHADLFSSVIQQGEASDVLRVRYEDTLAQLQQQQASVVKLTAANQRLLSASSQTRSMPLADKKRYDDEIDEAARLLADNEIAVRNLTEQVTSLQKDLETSRKSAAAALGAQAAAVEALPNARAMLLEMQTLQAQVQQMEKQLAQAWATSAQEVAQLADQLSLVTQTNQSLSSANRSLLSTKSSEIGVVQDELAEVRQELVQLTGQLADADEIISNQESMVAELTGANAGLNRGAKALELQMAQVVADEGDAQNELTAARTALSEHEQRAEMLLAQSSHESATNQTLQTKVNELTARVSSLQAEQARLRSVGILSAAQGDELIAQQNATISELTGANTDLDETKQVLELQLGRVVAEADRAQQELVAARTALAEREQRADMLLAQSSSDVAAKLVLQKKVAELNTQVATLRDEQSRLQSIEQLATGQEKELAELKLSLNNGDSLLAQQNMTIAELTGVNEELNKEKTALQTQLARESDQSGVVFSEIDTLQQQVDEQNEVARRLTEQADADLLSKQSLESQLSDLNSALEETQIRLIAVTESANDNSAEATRETEAKSELMEQLALSEARLSALLDENNRLAGVEKARELAEQQVVSLTAASVEWGNTQRELVELRTENTALDKMMRALERDRSSRIATLQQDNAALGARLQQAQGTLDQIASAARMINPGSGNLTPQIRGGNTRGMPVSRPAAAPREHIVVQGDSLSRISLRYYGRSNRWQDIYEANRDVLSRENVLRPGQRLKLP